MYRENRPLLYVPKLNSTSTLYFHNKHIFFCLFINIQSHRYLLRWCFFFFSLKKKYCARQTNRKDRFNTESEAKELKIRIRGGWGERRRSDAITDLNEHWHVCIITLFTAYSGLSLSLKRYWTPNLNILLYSALSSNLTPSQKRPINMLKPSSVKYVCACIMYAFIYDIIYTICYILKRLGYCRESLFRTNFTECCYWILSWAELCWAELSWA